MLGEQLVGTWRLKSCELRRSDGKTTHPYGMKPVGQLMYDAAGNMSVQVMKPGRPKFSVNDKFEGSAEEVKSAFDGYECYFGKYEVDEDKNTVTHHIEGSLLPNWEGKPQKRFFELSDDQLRLSSPPIQYAGATITSFLIWERKK